MENGSRGIDTCMSDPLDVNFVTLLDFCSQHLSQADCKNQHALHGAMGFHLFSAAASLQLASEGNSIINHLSLPANSFQAHGKVNGLRNLPLRLPDP